jgi:hypothetical protein
VPGPPPDGSGSVVLALSKIYFGDRRRDGTSDPLAWSQYGLDIDGKTTTECSTDVCTLVPGAPRSTQVDGNGGIDNSFGRNIVPILVTILGSTLDETTQADLQAGGPTTLLRIDALGSGADYAPLPGMLYRAASFDGAPAWNGSDVRDVDETSLLGGSLASPAIAFAGGYMTQRTWVGAPASGPGAIELDMALLRTRMPPLPMTHIQIAVNVDPSSGSATQGVLSAIVPTAAFVEWNRQLAGNIASSLCVSSSFDTIARQIEQASDIVTDGSNAPGSQCNGISLGIGFDATAVKLGSAVSAPPLPNACAGAGDADGG